MTDKNTKKQLPEMLRFLIKLFQIIFYIPIQIIFIPFAIIGLIDGIYKEILRKMADLCVDGSIIAQDFYSKAFSLGETSRIVKRNMSLIERMGEPWK